MCSISVKPSQLNGDTCSIDPGHSAQDQFDWWNRLSVRKRPHSPGRTQKLTISALDEWHLLYKKGGLSSSWVQVIGCLLISTIRNVIRSMLTSTRAVSKHLSVGVISQQSFFLFVLCSPVDELFMRPNFICLLCLVVMSLWLAALGTLALYLRRDVVCHPGAYCVLFGLVKQTSRANSGISCGGSCLPPPLTRGNVLQGSPPPWTANEEEWGKIGIKERWMFHS